MRIRPDLSFETTLWQAGVSLVAGLDEAGRGAWAGPISAGAVILPSDPTVLDRLWGVQDSKQMTPRQRLYWAGKIRECAIACSVGMASHEEIDNFGVLPATRLAMQRALQQLAPFPSHLLIDAVRLSEVPLPQTALIKGDARCLSIAAASVLAKTSRDELMIELDSQYPGYGFAQHKGYGTRRHQLALESLGACPHHRFSFAPLRMRLFADPSPVEKPS